MDANENIQSRTLASTLREIGINEVITNRYS